MGCAQSHTEPVPVDGLGVRPRRMSQVCTEAFDTKDVAFLSRMGFEPMYKTDNQDCGQVCEDFLVMEQTCMMVLDGHGPNGRHCSRFVMEMLTAQMRALYDAGEHPDIEDLMCESIRRVEGQLRDTDIDTRFSGTTLSICVLKDNVLTTVWCGDSRVVLGRLRPSGSYEAVDVSHDHKPDLEGEHARIKAAGGEVRRSVDPVDGPVGPWRVWVKGCEFPGLAMSRNAAGDDVARSVGVVSTPGVARHELATSDVVILATDGVWEFLSTTEAVDIVGSHPSLKDAVDALVGEARRRWFLFENGTSDDITAVVMRIP